MFSKFLGTQIHHHKPVFQFLGHPAIWQVILILIYRRSALICTQVPRCILLSHIYLIPVQEVHMVTTGSLVSLISENTHTNTYTPTHTHTHTELTVKVVVGMCQQMSGCFDRGPAPQISCH